MRFFNITVIFALLANATFGFSCPDGQYEMCVLPRPWGGCGQRVCVPNGGEVIESAANSVGDLSDGIMHFGDEMVRIPKVLGEKIGIVDGKVDERKFVKGTFVLAALWEGALCIATGGMSPGGTYTSPDGRVTSICSINSCGCVVFLLYGAYKLNEPVSPQQREEIETIANSKAFQDYVTSPNFDAEMDQEIAAKDWGKDR